MALVIGRVSSPTFVGRREELGVLADAISAAAAGSESVVLISGEPAGWRCAEALLELAADRKDVEIRLRRALDVARELDARPLREELEALARRARIDLDAAAGGSPGVAALTQLELTAREIDVLALIADGKTNRQIATELFISNKTASAHVSHILSKLSVHNRTAAAANARRLGLTARG